MLKTKIALGLVFVLLSAKRPDKQKPTYSCVQTASCQTSILSSVSVPPLSSQTHTLASDLSDFSFIPAFIVTMKSHQVGELILPFFLLINF